MTEIKNNSSIGQIQIADEVIVVIAGTATLEIDGVAGMTGNLTGGIAEMLGYKNLSKGIKIEIVEQKINISVNIHVRYGCKIQDVCAAVQSRVKTAVETMTGLDVGEVNVVVSELHVDKQKEKKDAGKNDEL